MLSIVFAESALELMPKEVWKHSFAKTFERKRRKKASEMLLDANKHYPIMHLIENKEKRGRPDIIHDLLKTALDSSLNKKGLLEITVHTYDDHVIKIDSETRIPRAFNSFCGLVEDLFEKKEIKTREGKTLLTMREKNLKELLAELDKKFVVFEAGGKQTKLKELVKKFGENAFDGVVIGGFAHGTFLDKSNALKELDKIALDERELTAPAILAKIITCKEIALESQ